MRPERRGGSVKEWCDLEGWKSAGRFSSDEARGGATNSGGIGGGARLDVKIPHPTERRGEGACRVGGGGLLLRSRVFISETDSFRRVNADKCVLEGRFSNVKGLCRTGEALRDGAGVEKGFIGAL
jgi:hypothetical protein